MTAVRYEGGSVEPATDVVGRKKPTRMTEGEAQPEPPGRGALTTGRNLSVTMAPLA